MRRATIARFDAFLPLPLSRWEELRRQGRREMDVSEAISIVSNFMDALGITKSWPRSPAHMLAKWASGSSKASEERLKLWAYLLSADDIRSLSTAGLEKLNHLDYSATGLMCEFGDHFLSQELGQPALDFNLPLFLGYAHRFAKTFRIPLLEPEEFLPFDRAYDGCRTQLAEAASLCRRMDLVSEIVGYVTKTNSDIARRSAFWNYTLRIDLADLVKEAARITGRHPGRVLQGETPAAIFQNAVAAENEWIQMVTSNFFETGEQNDEFRRLMQIPWKAEYSRAENFYSEALLK